MDFSILIPTMNSRNALFQKLLAEVNNQIQYIQTQANIEVLYEVDNGEMTLGAKRNLLVSRARGKYCCFIDDDDIISPTFLQTFLPMMNQEYDCASYVGAYYNNGVFEKLFYHSLDITGWYETEDRYWRSVSPMNMIKTDIVRKIQYKDIRDTEDHEFSIRLLKSGLLKSEFKIPYIPIYHYIDGVKKTRERWNYRWNTDFTRLDLFLGI